jgi:hypothetical protein
LEFAGAVPSLDGMAAWDALRQAIARLVEEQPGALAGYPDPHQAEGGPPPSRAS